MRNYIICYHVRVFTGADENYDNYRLISNVKLLMYTGVAYTHWRKVRNGQIIL